MTKVVKDSQSNSAAATFSTCECQTRCLGSGYEFVAGHGRAVGPGPGLRRADRACEQRLWAQSDTQIIERVQAALRVKAQADAVLLATIGEVEARGLARSRGASSTRAWLPAAHRPDPAEALMLVRTAASLRAGFEETGVALAAGQVNLGQARVVIRSVTDLPADLDPCLATAAETLMIGHCQTFDPSSLALIGRRLAECIDPDGTQARDEKKLPELEKTAHGKRGLTISPDKTGAGGMSAVTSTLRARRSSPPPWTGCPRRSWTPPPERRTPAVRRSAATTP